MENEFIKDGKIDIPSLCSNLYKHAESIFSIIDQLEDHNDTANEGHIVSVPSHQENPGIPGNSIKTRESKYFKRMTYSQYEKIQKKITEDPSLGLRLDPWPEDAMRAGDSDLSISKIIEMLQSDNAGPGYPHAGAHQILFYYTGGEAEKRELIRRLLTEARQRAPEGRNSLINYLIWRMTEGEEWANKRQKELRAKSNMGNNFIK